MKKTKKTKPTQLKLDLGDSKQECGHCIEVEKTNVNLFEVLKQVGTERDNLEIKNCEWVSDLNKALFQAKRWKGIAIVLGVILLFSLLK
jgi:hypothetical protein